MRESALAGILSPIVRRWYRNTRRKHSTTTKPALMAEEKSLAARLRNVRRRERRVRGIQPKNFNSSDKSSLSSRARCQGAISPFIPLASKRISMQNSGSLFFFFFFFSSRWHSFSAGFSLARSGISFVLGSEKCIDSVEIIQIRCMVNRPSEKRKGKGRQKKI